VQRSCAIFIAAAVALAAVTLCLTLRAQDLEPRAYSNSPTGPNFVIAGYGCAKGSVLTDPPLPLDNVSNDTHVGIVAGCAKRLQSARRPFHICAPVR